MSMRKPKPETAPAPTVAKKKTAVSRIIKRGGSVAADAVDDKKSVQLRVESTLLDRIDVVREAVPSSIRASRHTWMMQAILEKLGREEG